MKTLLIFLFIISSAYAQNFEDLFKDTQPVEDTADDFIKFCRSLDKIAPFAQEYRVMPWVNVGSPGFVLAQFENSSIMFEICDYYIDIKKNDETMDIYNTMNVLNKMTNDRWDDQFNLLTGYHSITKSLYDLEKGEFRKGSLTSASNHQRIIKSIDRTKKFFYKRNNPDGGRPEGLENAASRNRKINEISSLAYTQAILSESISCPKPKLKTNQKDLYKKEIIPKQEKLKEIEVELDYYAKQLVRMGADMYIGGESEKYKRYVLDINYIQSGYISFNEQQKVEKRETNTLTDKTDSEGNPIWKDVAFNEKYNHFTIKKDFKYFSELKKKYVADWSSYITNQKVSKARAFANDAQGKIEKKYRKFAFECSEIKLRNKSSKLRKLPQKETSYRILLNSLIETCYENLRYQEESFKSLMEKYLTNAGNLSQEKHQLLAAIWNFEGKYLGYNRTVVSESTPENFQRTQIKCSETLQPSQIRSVGLSMNSVKLKIKQEILEGKLKSNLLREAELEARSEDKQETGSDSIRRKERAAESSKTNSYTTPITRTRGGI